MVYNYYDDLSELVALLDRYTNLSNLKLLQVAVENKNLILANAITKRVTIDDDTLLSRISELNANDLSDLYDFIDLGAFI